MDVTFPSNGTEGQGYLAIPASGSGPGVVVLQEWWGINDQIREVCDRFASEGFVALAPDIYRGVDSVVRSPEVLESDFGSGQRPNGALPRSPPSCPSSGRAWVIGTRDGIAPRSCSPCR